MLDFNKHDIMQILGRIIPNINDLWMNNWNRTVDEAIYCVTNFPIEC